MCIDGRAVHMGASHLLRSIDGKRTRGASNCAAPPASRLSALRPADRRHPVAPLHQFLTTVRLCNATVHSLCLQPRWRQCALARARADGRGRAHGWGGGDARARAMRAMQRPPERKPAPPPRMRPASATGIC